MAWLPGNAGHIKRPQALRRDLKAKTDLEILTNATLPLTEATYAQSGYRPNLLKRKKGRIHSSAAGIVPL